LRKSTENFGTRLYDNAKEQAKKIAEKRVERELELRRANTPSKKISNQLLEQKKWRIFNEIFRSLDTDNDGKISPANIDILKLPDSVLEIITPLLCELDEVNREVDREEFLLALDKLYNKLEVHDKNMVLSMGKPQGNKIENDPCTFKVKRAKSL
jgi:hypothetical protein